MKRGTLTWVARAALVVVIAVCACMARAAADGGSPAPLIVRGQVLAVGGGFLAFTTGDAVRLGDVKVPPGIGLGRTVRVTIDRQTHTVTAIDLDLSRPVPGEIDASELPRDDVSVDPRSAQTPAAGHEVVAGASTGLVTVTIDVHVPDVTPPSDDVYIATDRTNYSAAELRMNRVDALDWTVTLPLPAGSALRYEFTRGSQASIERMRDGTLVTPRELTAATGAVANDTVARWADKF